MRKEFTDRYHYAARVSKSILRCIYDDITADLSSAPSLAQRCVDERVAKAVLSIENPGIIPDLQTFNGNPKSTLFDGFWTELSAFLEEINPAVDYYRHGETLHMPIAVSIRHLREVIAERLQLKFPGQKKKHSWIRLQFWPKNPFCSDS